ncbi:hypothetical protein [Streptomyces sp. NPDC000880]
MRDIVLRPTLLSLLMAMLIVVAAVLLFALLALDRPPTGLLVYTAVLVLITVGGSGFFESKPRFLLPAFPLLLPLACALTKSPAEDGGRGDRRPGRAFVRLRGVSADAFPDRTVGRGGGR